MSSCSKAPRHCESCVTGCNTSCVVLQPVTQELDSQHEQLDGPKQSVGSVCCSGATAIAYMKAVFADKVSCCTQAHYHLTQRCLGFPSWSCNAMQAAQCISHGQERIQCLLMHRHRGEPVNGALRLPEMHSKADQGVARSTSGSATPFCWDWLRGGRSRGQPWHCCTTASWRCRTWPLPCWRACSRACPLLPWSSCACSALPAWRLCSLPSGGASPRLLVSKPGWHFAQPVRHDAFYSVDRWQLVMSACAG